MRGTVKAQHCIWGHVLTVDVVAGHGGVGGVQLHLLAGGHAASCGCRLACAALGQPILCPPSILTLECSLNRIEA